MHDSRTASAPFLTDLVRNALSARWALGEKKEVSRSGASERRTPPSRWSLLVAGRAQMDTVRLPTQGTIVIGRSPACAITIADASVADEHALLRLDDPITLVDLGSGRPTKVANRPVPKGAEVPLSPGVVFTIGEVTCVVQRSMHNSRLRPIRSHDYFEARVEDECSRVAQTGGSFAVARFLVREGMNASVEEILVSAPRPMDVVATYTPDEYEVLFLDVTMERAEELALDIVARVRAEGALVDHAIACFPSDARTPEAVFSIVTTALHSGAKSDSVVPEGTMARLRPLVERVASSAISVLILGETGVGKEVMATTIHALSPRSRRRMLSINCAALSEPLLDSELFGYERGAFTGAVATKAGLLESAEGGTVFLDEIGEMPLPIQAKLLRVIEQKVVTRLGALTPRPIDVRFLAATNRDLEDDVAHGTFRRDLYFRLAAFTIAIPPLRERVPEIESLANAFIAEASLSAGRAPPELSIDAVAMLEAYAWPGNIRELRNVIDRAMLLAPGRLIEPAHLPVDKMRRALPSLRPPPLSPPLPRETMTLPPPTLVTADAPPGLRRRVSGVVERHDFDAGDGAEREAIVRALDACAGNQTKAAQLLGIGRRTLINRIERYGLPRPKK